ncbi:hypothetical protein AMECASPLE_021317 [Ameca splendens]|uniref:Uncharacterized protein n=1 Tax=Ameca splendens TaxID=208324 RepID=A0ABV0XGI9_9TELE
MDVVHVHERLTPEEPQHEFLHTATPDIKHMPPNPNAMNPFLTAQGHTPTGELHPRKADEVTPTQRKLHTQPHSKHPCRILHPTTQRAMTERQGKGPGATLPQPPSTGAKVQTPSSTAPTTEPSKRSPASGKHLGPASPSTPPRNHTTSLPLQR